MVWGDGNPLAFTLDRADLWDLRLDRALMDHPDYNYARLRRLISERRFEEVRELFEARQARDNPPGPTKISIGRAEIQIGTATRYECCLDIDKGVVEGSLPTETGEHGLRILVHRNRNLLCVRVSRLPRGAEMVLVPLADTTESLAKLGHPRPQAVVEAKRQLVLQQIPDGPSYAICWNRTGPDFLMAVEAGASCEEEALGIEVLSPPAKEVHEKLVPYHLTEHKALCLCAGKLLDDSHRHPNHLMPIHPAMDLTIEGGREIRAIIRASVDHYLSLGRYR